MPVRICILETDEKEVDRAVSNVYYCTKHLIQRYKKEGVMAWKFENDRPIYTQLLEKIEQMIISGKYPAGEKLPSVRELAAEASVNPNTMQRAMSELENRGLIVTNRTAGKTVTQNQDILQKMKTEKAVKNTQIYVRQMESLGFNKEEIIALIEKGEKK